MAHNTQWPSKTFNGLKTIELHRKENTSIAYGFSIRGGCEYGIGVYVSEVIEGSIARTQGLKVGDKILSVNGLPLEEAVHEEVLNLILKSMSPLVLKVRNVGMIPVRSQHPGLSWVSTENINFKDLQEVQMNIDLSKTKKFGCSICKGPIDRPGIFVQSTVDGGMAREVGLQVGDQLLTADGKNLTDMSFQEVVQYLKSCKSVEFLVRKKAAMDLFPSNLSSDELSLNTNDSNETPPVDTFLNSTRKQIEIPKSVTKKDIVEVGFIGSAKMDSNRPLEDNHMVETNNRNDSIEFSALASDRKEVSMEEIEKTEELQSQGICVPKLEIKEQEEAVRNVTMSSFKNEIRCFADQHETSDSNQISTGHEPHQKDNNEDSYVNKHGKKLVMWMKTPLAEITGSSEPQINQEKHHSSQQGEAETNSENVKEKKVSHDRLIEEFRKVHKQMLTVTKRDKKILEVAFNSQRKSLKKDKKSVSFADSEIAPDSQQEDDVEGKNKSTDLLCNVKVQNFILKPSPHMFVDPLSKMDVEKSPETSPNNLIVSKDQTISRKNITDSSPSSPKPPAFFWASAPKAKVTIGSYESSHIPQRMSAYLPTNINVINITKRVFLDETKLPSEAKPLVVNKLSVINSNATDEHIQSSSVSFSAARAKFLTSENQLTVDKKKIPLASKVLRENNVLCNGHKISIKIPDEQIVIVKRTT